MKRYIHPFDPIIFNDSKTLVLGTFPSIVSFEDNFYYAHKRNQFWKLLGDIFKMPANTKEERIALLKEHKIALWDIIASCKRQNSSDTNLKNVELNDIPALLSAYPSIERIAFTGKKAQQLYNKLYKDLPVETFLLPSPSPAYAAMKYEEKLKHYRQFFKN